MATASITHVFAANTLAEASKVNTNFTNVVDFLNNSVLHADGAISLTGQLTLYGADPTTSNHATRKLYVDNRTSKAWGRIHTLEVGQSWPTIAAFDTWYNQSTPMTITNPNIGAVNIAAFGIISGYGLNNTATVWGAVDISIDGGTSYTSNSGALARSNAVGDNGAGAYSQQWCLNPMMFRTGTPTGDIKVRLGIYQPSGYVNKANIQGSRIIVLISGTAL